VFQVRFRRAHRRLASSRHRWEISIACPMPFDCVGHKAFRLHWLQNSLAFTFAIEVRLNVTQLILGAVICWARRQLAPPLLRHLATMGKTCPEILETCIELAATVERYAPFARPNIEAHLAFWRYLNFEFFDREKWRGLPCGRNRHFASVERRSLIWSNSVRSGSCL
jgi:hypothetical protein